MKLAKTFEYHNGMVANRVCAYTFETAKKWFVHTIGCDIHTYKIEEVADKDLTAEDRDKLPVETLGYSFLNNPIH